MREIMATNINNWSSYATAAVVRRPLWVVILMVETASGAFQNGKGFHTTFVGELSSIIEKWHMHDRS